MNSKQYKPILVLYIKDLILMSMDMKNQLQQQVAQMKDDLGYNILLFPGNEYKAEIISVNKATVVEDIQKYIDLKLIEKPAFSGDRETKNMDQV